MIKTRQQYEIRARIAKALAHPTRLLLLDALSEEERCVTELTELVGSDQSTVSKHLAILKDSGFLDVEKQGAQNFYSIRCNCLDDFFGCIESLLHQKVSQERGLVEL